mgnify:CR=1 FL=1
MKHYITPEEHARMQRRRGRQALGLLVAILELGVEQVMVIGHTDCGVQGMDGNELLGELVELSLIHISEPTRPY